MRIVEKLQRWMSRVSNSRQGDPELVIQDADYCSPQGWRSLPQTIAVVSTPDHFFRGQESKRKR